ncbi:acetylornithine deacetylase, partial [Xanthomonas perforans]|nr:acetylornithine deacetylase [Xanthomonas perforans]
MTDLLTSTLDHLQALVAFDTRNPPRAIAAQGGIFDYLRAQLPGFQVEVVDHGAGAVSL